MRIRIVQVAGIFALLAGAGSASAGVLLTPPFPATVANAGVAGCQATNVGTKDGEVTVELMSNDGVVTASDGPTVVAPGVTSLTVLDEIEGTTYPTRCRFEFKGKFKGSYFWRNVAETDFVVVPAEK